MQRRINFMYASIVGDCVSFCEENVYGENAIDLGDAFSKFGHCVPKVVNGKIEWLEIIEKDEKSFKKLIDEIISKI